MNTNKKESIIGAIILIVILGVAALLFFKVKRTAPVESMPSLSQSDDALNAPSTAGQIPAKTGSSSSSASASGQSDSSTINTAAPIPTGMTLISKIGIEIPYPIDYIFASQPQGNLASPTCSKSGVDENTGAKCNYITPNMGSELITFTGHGNTENVDIITSDTSGYNANACQMIAGTSEPSFTVGGKTIYHTTSGNSETFCAVTPTYTFNLTRNISTTPEIDVTKILFK